MEDPFIRTQMLLGAPAMERLRASHVAVFGLGGVGSWCAEALCRSGVGELTLVDQDTVSVSNLNRQASALRSTVGMEKARAAVLRFQDIAPGCALHPVAARYEAETRDRFFAAQYDYIVDAIDTVTGKLTLVQQANEAGTPIISAMGAGNKLDPSAFQVADISQTSMCPLARIMRKELKKRDILHLKVVYSKEQPRTPQGVPEPDPGRKTVPGSVSFVPSVMGLILAGEVIKELGIRN